MENSYEVKYPIHVFISSDCKSTNEDFIKIRKEIKDKIEATKLAKVYLFEDFAGTGEAKSNFMFQLDQSHVCIFLIENGKEIPNGVAQEYKQVILNKKKAIYIFYAKDSIEPTWIQRELTGPDKPQNKTVKSYDEFVTTAFQSLLDDIVMVYQKYSHLYLVSNMPNETTYSLGESGNASSIIDRQTVAGIKNTKLAVEEQLAPYPITKHVQAEPADKFDSFCSKMLNVLICKEPFSNINPLILFTELEKGQNTTVFELSKKRWDAILYYWTGDIESAINALEKAYKYSISNTIPEWLQQDVLIDLRNLKWKIKQEQGIWYPELEEQKILNGSHQEVHYPILDRAGKQFYNDLNDKRNKKFLQSIYTTEIGGNISTLTDQIASILAISVYYGSITHLELIVTYMADLALFLYEDFGTLSNQQKVIKFFSLVGNPGQFRKICEKCATRSTLSASSVKEIYDLNANKASENNRFISELSVIENLGYFFSDVDYAAITNEINQKIEAWLLDDQKVVFAGDNIIKTLKSNIYRMNPEKILDFCSEIFERHYDRYIIEICELINYIARELISSTSEKVKMRFIRSISSVYKSQTDDTYKGYLERTFFEVLRKEPRGLIADYLLQSDSEELAKYYTQKSDEEASEPYPIDRYMDEIKERNSTQGKNGTYSIYVSSPYASIFSCLIDDDCILTKEQVAKLLSLCLETLSLRRQLASEKKYAFMVLLCIGSIKETSIIEEYSSFLEELEKIQDNATIGFNAYITSDYSYTLKFLLNLILFINGRETNASIMEILTVENTDENLDRIGILEAIFIFGSKYITNEYKEMSFLFQLLTYCFTCSNADAEPIRIKSYKAISQLINQSTYQVISRRLLQAYDIESIQVKVIIIDSIKIVNKYDRISADGLLQKAKMDENFIIRQKIKIINMHSAEEEEEN